MSDPKLDYLQTIQEKQAITDQVLKTIDTIQAGGPAGILVAALTEPETILEALNSLGDIIRSDQSLINDLVEKRMQLIDDLEQIHTLINQK